jgi:hypothetical protein
MRFVSLTLIAAVVLMAAADADAAWNPSATSYTGTIGNVRNSMSRYLGTRASASTISARAQHYVQKADRRLSNAMTVLGRNPGWSEISSSLKQLGKAVYYLEKAGRKARSVSAFQSMLYGSSTGILPILYGLSETFANEAAAYVVRTFSSARAARKLLMAGGDTSKAKRLANQSPPRFSRAVGKNRDAIKYLGRRGLL